MSKDKIVHDVGVSVIIPAYNEDASIVSVLNKLSSVLESTEYKHEILVVNDASTDKTAVLASEAGARVINHEVNQGYGASIKYGIRNAHHDFICITDADETYPSERIPELISFLYNEDYDMAVGSRTGANVAIPLIRRPAKMMIGALANLVVGIRIPDINSGLRVFRRSTAMRFLNILPDGFSLTTTITLAMLSSGYSVKYLPIDYHVRMGKSKIRPIRDTINFMQLIFRIALYFAPLKIFVPLSMLTMLLAVVWGVFSWTVLGSLADISTLVIVMTSIQIGSLGLLAELINKRVPNEYKHDADDC